MVELEADDALASAAYLAAQDSRVEKILYLDTVKRKLRRLSTLGYHGYNAALVGA